MVARASCSASSSGSAIGLLGGTRVERLHGHGVLTFHFPFIIAALALGGPTAGALVALISTIERRELRDMPWYGLLSNHAALTMAAVAGGLTILGTRSLLASLAPQEVQAAELVAIVAGSVVLAMTATGLAAGHRGPARPAQPRARRSTSTTAASARRPPPRWCWAGCSG